MKYLFSFTMGGLLLSESRTVADALFRSNGDWGGVKEMVLKEDLLRKTTVNTRKRVLQEIRQRFRRLTPEELQCLRQGALNVRVPIILAAVCRRYSFIRDVILKVLSQVKDRRPPVLRHSDLQTFLDGVAIEHPEYTRLAESSRRQVRTRVLQMFREAGLLSREAEPKVAPILLPPGFEEHFARQHPDELPLFLYGPAEIRRIQRRYRG